MGRRMRFAAVMCACLAAMPPAFAASQTPDYSDLWFNPEDPGWGVSVTHGASTLFVVLFQYDSAGKPTWYVAPDVRLRPSVCQPVFTDPDCFPMFRGALYATTKPAGSGTGVSEVGTLTFESSFHALHRARLTYVVNGATFTRDIERQSNATENLSGTFIGAASGSSQCASLRPVATPATYSVQHTPASGQVLITEVAGGRSCEYRGTYVQQGRVGAIAGTSGQCSDGTTFTRFSAREVRVSTGSLSMHMTAVSSNGCSFWGQIGGARQP